MNRQTSIGLTIAVGVALVAIVLWLPRKSADAEQLTALPTEAVATDDPVEAAVQKVPQVLACFLVAGENDYLLRIAAKSVDDFGRIHTHFLSSLPHVLRMESNFVMRTVMNRGLDAEEIH